MSVRVQAAVAALLARAPARLRRALAGPEVVVDGQGLAVDARLLTRQARGRSVLVVDDSPEASRAALTRAALVLWAGHRPSKEVSARPVILTGGETSLRATLYEPARGGPSGLLVFFHGGGWVIGSAHVYDHVGCFLVERTGHRVLSVDYRLAPDDPFPAAVNDALAAFDAAWSRSVEWSVDPDRIVVGGDSAGATIAAVVARQTAQRGDGLVPSASGCCIPRPTSPVATPPISDHGSPRPPSTPPTGSRFCSRDLGARALRTTSFSSTPSIPPHKEDLPCTSRSLCSMGSTRST